MASNSNLLSKIGTGIEQIGAEMKGRKDQIIKTGIILSTLLTMNACTGDDQIKNYPSWPMSQVESNEGKPLSSSSNIDTNEVSPGVKEIDGAIYINAKEYAIWTDQNAKIRKERELLEKFIKEWKNSKELKAAKIRISQLEKQLEESERSILTLLDRNGMLEGVDKQKIRNTYTQVSTIDIKKLEIEWVRGVNLFVTRNGDGNVLAMSYQLLFDGPTQQEEAFALASKFVNETRINMAEVDEKDGEQTNIFGLEGSTGLEDVTVSNRDDTVVIVTKNGDQLLYVPNKNK